MRNIWSLNTINKKFLVPTLVLTTVLLLGLGGFIAMKNKSSIRAMMDAKGNAVADFTTTFSADYFAFFDFNDFENFVRALETDPEVEFAVFYNAQDEALTDTSKIPKDLSDLIVYERHIKDSMGNDLGHLTLGYNKSNLRRNLNENLAIILISTLVALGLLAVGITLLVREVIVKRVKAKVEMLKDIAEGEGDLTKRLHADSEDELGELAKWFNTFVNNIQGIIKTVQASVSQLSSESRTLSATSDDLNKGSKQQTVQTEQIVAAMSEMSQTIFDVAKNASDSREASKEASEIAVKGKSTVDQTVEGMTKIAETVREASATIEELGSSSSEIGNIIKVIDEIADQTNLLALNAAIEAARAGEQGRGFAVVADEVRKLAERTGRATKEIVVMIEKIQADTEKSVTSMNLGKNEVEKGVTIAEEAKSALDVIVETSNKAADSVHRIATAAEEQSAATEEVANTMEDILRITNRSSDATGNIKSASDGLEHLSLELEKKIGWFKVD